MNIINTTTRDKKTLYQLTKGADVKRLQEAEGLELIVRNFIIYDDEKGDGSTMRVLAFEADTGGADPGAMYATNSPTFISTFSDICTICGDEAADIIGEKIRVASGISKSGRKFFSCVWA